MLHARNEVLSVTMRCPLPYAFAMILFRVARRFGVAWTQGLGWLVREPVWWWQAFGKIPECLRIRKPVAWRAYWQWLRLGRNPAFTEMEIRERFDFPDAVRCVTGLMGEDASPSSRAN
jgi:hypothetical protein